jgi:hypothetical protein
MTCLKLDFDSQDAFTTFLERKFIIKTLGLDITGTRVYKTAHGYHVYMYCSNGIQPMKSLVLQAILGSDYLHVLGALRKLDEGAASWNTLFAVKWSTNPLGEKAIDSMEEFDEVFSRRLFEYLVNGAENAVEKAIEA